MTFHKSKLLCRSAAMLIVAVGFVITITDVPAAIPGHGTLLKQQVNDQAVIVPVDRKSVV